VIQLNEEKAKFFLAKNNFVNCSIQKVAGDASFRSYYRIFHGKESFILMFAPPGHEDIRPFMAIDNFLVENNFSAPKIFAVDKLEGFLLLEDFGDDSYTKVLAASKDKKNLEFELYKNATDCLLELHKTLPPQDLPQYNHDLLFREVMLFVDWYLVHNKKIILSIADIARFKALWFDLFDLINRENQVLVLRDYHADNLMLLSGFENYKSVGLLDFQDAVLGSRAYDLVSLLEDARRDVIAENRQKIIAHYLSLSQLSDEGKKSFMLDYEILSLQRNIKIIGIFSRLAARDSKPHYLNLLPRVINFVKLRLASDNSALAEISVFLQKFI